MASSLEALCFFYDTSKTSPFQTGHADEYAGLNCILKIKWILKLSHFRKNINAYWKIRGFRRLAILEKLLAVKSKAMKCMKGTLTIISTVWSAKSSGLVKTTNSATALLGKTTDSCISTKL
eukprot:TRINITY_DN26719_c3_g1_i1.p1 TRINITY_DN26719_c3_g1~~TRINITY_DN26719_c3_g1_i1.p1  ORF type:complete len:121 (+),score=12.66 TRINITY_DN26719_c3_g1_i1:381-743(+)